MAIRLSETGGPPRAIETADRSTAVVHDIKNSVSALSLLARNAASNFADPEFQRDAIATLSRTVDRMRGLLVKLSSPEAEPAPLRVEPIDLQELILEATTPLVAAGKGRFVRRLHPVPAVYGDRDALLRVVENLTTNATEAIDHEGTVTVTLAEDEGHAIISVTDTGPGIPEEYRQRHLFYPFRSTKKNGWGVGLYHTKQAVERQSGEILVESVEGHGTTFIVKLPVRADVERRSLETVR
jgi:signal transduction histidine kinase